MDDSLLLLKADLEYLKNLRCILLIVEVATRLTVKWSKLTISPVGVVVGIEAMADVFGCEVVSLPSSYLGLPLGAKSASSSIWNPVIEKLGSRLARWKGNYLSFGGK